MALTAFKPDPPTLLALFPPARPPAAPFTAGNLLAPRTPGGGAARLAPPVVLYPPPTLPPILGLGRPTGLPAGLPLPALGLFILLPVVAAMFPMRLPAAAFDRAEVAPIVDDLADFPPWPLLILSVLIWFCFLILWNCCMCTFLVLIPAEAPCPRTLAFCLLTLACALLSWSVEGLDLAATADLPDPLAMLPVVFPNLKRERERDDKS